MLQIVASGLCGELPLGFFSFTQPGLPDYMAQRPPKTYSQNGG